MKASSYLIMPDDNEGCHPGSLQIYRMLVADLSLASLEQLNHLAFCPQCRAEAEQITYDLQTAEHIFAGPP